MRLRRPCGPTNAVAACAPTEQNNNVAWTGFLAADMACWGGANNGADLHALGNIPWVVELAHLACGQANLVAVGGISRSSGKYKLSLWELAFQRLGDRGERVGCTSYAHGLVDVGAPRKWVADGATNAGSSSAKRLDLGGVVVGLVLKEEEPILIRAINIDFYLNGASVDLLRLIQVRELACVLEPLGAEGAHVHQRYGTIFAPQLAAHLEIALEGGANGVVVDRYMVELCAKGRVAAVVRPVGVDHADLGDGWVALLAGKVVLTKSDIGEVHGKAEVVDHFLQLLAREVAKSIEGFDHGRLGVAHL